MPGDIGSHRQTTDAAATAILPRAEHVSGWLPEKSGRRRDAIKAVLTERPVQKIHGQGNQKPRSAVSRMRCRTWLPRSGAGIFFSGFPHNAGHAHKKQGRLPFLLLVRLAPRHKSRALQGNRIELIRSFLSGKAWQ
ncbi:hypothetical protein RSDT_0673 [Candidatus Desulfovibrio trichonymphae]|uniref:Uncharacterized protein n=1 Tax=Candidatus Desulfovibrio trichonymphae TaxID=1725232 RepID=A0A1J1DQR7_9BACT|nr:hypothetical protein RSDT_0673 [Candidatus Desulfovibrio trichonymphae]